MIVISKKWLFIVFGFVTYLYPLDMYIGMNKKYRYEFYIPMRYNDGRLIEKRKFDTLKDMIAEKFSGVSVHYIRIAGEWKDPYTGRVFKDESIKYEVAVDKKEEKFFLDLKEKMKDIFKQKDIYLLRTTVDFL